MKISRRKFVGHAVCATAGSFCLTLVACKPQKGESSPGLLRCTDTTGLTAGEIEGRTNLGYVDQTSLPSKRCDNCNLWIPAVAEQAQKPAVAEQAQKPAVAEQAQKPEAPKCGGCKIMKGPIHPAGYCTAWAPGVVKKPT